MGLAWYCRYYIVATIFLKSNLALLVAPLELPCLDIVLIGGYHGSSALRKDSWYALQKICSELFTFIWERSLIKKSLGMSRVVNKHWVWSWDNMDIKEGSLVWIPNLRIIKAFLVIRRAPTLDASPSWS